MFYTWHILPLLLMFICIHFNIHSFIYLFIYLGGQNVLFYLPARLVKNVVNQYFLWELRFLPLVVS